MTSTIVQRTTSKGSRNMAWERLLSGVWFLLIALFVENMDSCPPGCFCNTRSFTCKRLTSFPVPPPSAEVVEISESKFDEIPSNAFGPLPSLKRVSFRNCDIGVISQCAFSGLSNVQLNINGSRIQTVDSHAFFQLSEIELTISKSVIGEIKPYAFSCIDQVHFWDLLRISVTTLSSRAIYNVSEVKSLQIHSSTFQEIEAEAISELRSIAKFDMISNNILNLSCHGIENLLMTVPDSMFFFNNKAFCDCRLAWLWSSDKVSSKQILQGSSCYGPEQYAEVRLAKINVGDLQCGPISCPEFDADSVPESRPTCRIPQQTITQKETIPGTTDTPIPLDYSSETRLSETVTSRTRQRFATTNMTTAKQPTSPGTAIRWTTTVSGQKIEMITDRPPRRPASTDSLNDTETTVTEAPNPEREEITSSWVISRSSASWALEETGTAPASSAGTNGLEDTTPVTSVEIGRTKSTETNRTFISPSKDVPSTEAQTRQSRYRQLSPASIDRNVIDNVTSKGTTHSEPVGRTLVPSISSVRHSEATSYIETPRSSTDRSSTEETGQTKSTDISSLSTDHAATNYVLPAAATHTDPADYTATGSPSGSVRSSGATSSIDATRPLSDRMSTDTVTRYSDGTIPGTPEVLSGRTALDDLDSGVTDAVSSANSHDTEPVNIDTSRKPFVNSTNAQHAAITTGSKTATGKESPVGGANTPTEVPLPKTTNGRQESQATDGPAISGTVRGGSSSLHFSENGYSFLKMVLPLFLFTCIY